MRFYLDEDLSPRIAAIARRAGVDCVSSHEAGRDRLSDQEQLRLAAADGRCIVTRNRKHFVQQTTEFMVHGWAHAGVLLVAHSFPDDDFGGIAAALVQYAQDHPDDMPSYMVDYLTPARRP